MADNADPFNLQNLFVSLQGRDQLEKGPASPGSARALEHQVKALLQQRQELQETVARMEGQAREQQRGFEELVRLSSSAAATSGGMPAGEAAEKRVVQMKIQMADLSNQLTKMASAVEVRQNLHVPCSASIEI